MLPKQQRLSAREVRAVLARGQTARLGTANIRYLQADRSGAAVVVSAAVAKKATERNRLRRAGYQALTFLPKKKHLVLFVRSRAFNPADASALCLKLS